MVQGFGVQNGSKWKQFVAGMKHLLGQDDILQVHGLHLNRTVAPITWSPWVNEGGGLICLLC
jgi:hypothetical protein